MTKLLFALLIAFTSTQVFAETNEERTKRYNQEQAAQDAADLKWARNITGFKDERVIPSSCSTTSGTSSFKNPGPGVYYYCLGSSAKLPKGSSALVFESARGVWDYFTVSDCVITRAIGEQGGGERDETCKITALDSETLKPLGRTVNIYFFTSWDYSEGGTSFKFKLNNVKREGWPVSISELQEYTR